MKFDLRRIGRLYIENGVARYKETPPKDLHLIELSLRDTDGTKMMTDTLRDDQVKELIEILQDCLMEVTS